MSKLTRPYPYTVRVGQFGHTWEIWDNTGQTVISLMRVPVSENIPIDGVLPGLRRAEWRQDEEATVVWTEALDGGNPHTPAAHRDKLMMLRAPFQSQPEEILRTKYRLQYSQLQGFQKPLIIRHL